ncbi:MAG: ferrous iron transport protein A [Clostridia bacterium]|nr:ferrous iron transport protein A [Clostridia bacterium]
MLPLSMAKIGEINRIVKITGKDETKRFLNNLGFVEGAEVSIISEMAGNLIVHIQSGRVALDRDLVKRIMI